MAIKKLILKKERINDKYSKNIEAFILKANERIDHALKDEIKDTKVSIGFYNHLRTLISFDKSEYLNMHSKDRLEYAKKWFITKDNDIRLLIARTEEYHKSLLEDIDQQINYYSKELDRINKEAQLIEGKGKWKQFTMNRKKKKVERSANV